MNPNWIVEVDPVGGIEFFMHQMTGNEALGRPFKYDLEVLTEDTNHDLDDLLGQPMTVRLELPDEKIRYFNGLISEASFSGLRGQSASYQVVLRPWLWFLSKSSDCQIFQNKNVPDIIKQVFGDNGFSDFDMQLTRTYEVREFCVQYRESHFDFVSRLMEDEGIYYYFGHENGKHKLVLADSHSAHSPAPGYSEITYYPPDDAPRNVDHIDDWMLCHQVCTSTFSTDSYDYESPGANLQARSEVSRQHALAGGKRYDYGALYTKSGIGDAYAKTRIQEFNANQAVGRAHGDSRGVSCGALFSLTGYPRDDQNKEYLVIDAAYFIVNSDPETGGGGATASFDVDFTALDSQTPFRPARVTPSSIVRGPQTAVVVGKSGEEIWTDKYGRVKVQFHWDDEGERDENSSCWVRVAHAWAGKTWGAIAIPRIGQEVIVDFLEGDPDQPLITGSVYNDDNMPPYTLPDNQTQSGVKTRSSKKGNKTTFNELRFEDKKGNEEIYFHAEKDFKRVVENDDTLTVGLEDKDKGDQTITIHNNRTTTLNEGTDSLTVESKDRIVKIQKGNDTLDVKKTIKIDAGDELVVTVGQAKLSMKKNGDIKLDGVNITINGKMKVDVKATQIGIEGKATTDVKSPKTSVEGQGMLDLKAGGMAKLKGSITMIG